MAFQSSIRQRTKQRRWAIRKEIWKPSKGMARSFTVTAAVVVAFVIAARVVHGVSMACATAATSCVCPVGDKAVALGVPLEPAVTNTVAARRSLAEEQF
mmetsp:Transcript_6626/g.13135  ORF Transcript_6626/g.13135 Transcript_6626/m.13135 type:complete len:99 (+) Transcript_6626:915-1211(+)